MVWEVRNVNPLRYEYQEGNNNVELQIRPREAAVVDSGLAVRLIQRVSPESDEGVKSEAR